MELLLKKRQELKEANTEIVKFFDGVSSDRLPTEEEKSKMTDLQKKVSDLSKDVKDLEEREAIQRSAKDYLKDYNEPAGRGAQNVKDLEAEQEASEVRIANLGKHVFNDRDFKEWHKNNRSGNSPLVHIPNVKSLITGASSTSAGAFVVADRTNIVDPGAIMQQLSLIDLVSTGTTDSDTVELVRTTSFTNNAAETAEAEADGTPSGAKPESTGAFAVAQFTVQSIPHWVALTKRALADASQVQSIINNFLLYGLRERLNSQMFAGDGIAPNIEGLDTVTGTTTQAFSNSIIETMLKARTKVKTTGKAKPSAYILNPTDNETLLLQQDGQDRYYFGGPNAYGIQTVWGLPVVEDETLVAGYTWCADWKLAQLWIRENATIAVAEQHGENFTKNIVVILAEMRAAFGLHRPAAFVKAVLTA